MKKTTVNTSKYMLQKHQGPCGKLRVARCEEEASECRAEGPPRRAKIAVLALQPNETQFFSLTIVKFAGN
jgi:hypothetical protein